MTRCSDQESKEASFLEHLTLTNGAPFPFPDGAHVIKLIRSTLYNWWIFVDGAATNLRILLPLRGSWCESTRDAVFQAVSAAMINNKDKMNVDTAIEALSFQLTAALPADTLVTQTLFPELTPLVDDCPPAPSIGRTPRRLGCSPGSRRSRGRTRSACSSRSTASTTSRCRRR